jgi:hypothetical protein
MLININLFNLVEQMDENCDGGLSEDGNYFKLHPFHVRV